MNDNQSARAVGSDCCETLSREGRALPGTNPDTAGYPCAFPVGPAPGASLHRGPFSKGVMAMNEARRQPVAACGWVWASQTDAARALGVGSNTVHYRIKRGTFDKLVMDKLGTNTQ